MKFKFKNLIAFTLSEMMIVLLIVSVISAATIPTITQQKQKPYNFAQSNSTGPTSELFWKLDNFSGIFSDLYVKNDEKPLVIDGIGGDIDKFRFPDSFYSNLSLYLRKEVTLSEKTADEGQIMLYQKDKYVGSVGVVNSPNISIDNSFRYISMYMGYGAFYSKNLAKASGNLAIGYYALNAINSLDGYNIAIGERVMDRVINGSSTISIGSYAGYYSNRYDSVSVGAYAGSNASRYYYSSEVTPAFMGGSIDLGYKAGNMGYASVNGVRKPLYSNISIGAYAGNYVDAVIKEEKNAASCIPCNKISIGTYAGYGTTNSNTISIGYLAGAIEPAQSIWLYRGDYKDPSHDNDIAIGYYSHYTDHVTSVYDTGTVAYSQNIFIGSYAGAHANDDVRQAIVIGKYAGTPNFSAYKTPAIAIGYRASGLHGDISLGTCAGNGTYDYYSIMIGRYAGYGSTGSVVGFNNIYIGRYAGYLQTGGARDGSIAIGNEAGALTSVGGKYTKGGGLLIGYGAFAGLDSYSSHNTMMILPYASKSVVSDTGGHYELISAGNFGSMAIGPGYGYPGGPSFNKTILVLYAAKIYAKNTNFTPFTSDRRSKENIVKSKYGIEQFRNINVYTYNFKFDNDKKAPRVGVIAQEVQKYIPEAIVKSADGTLNVDFDWILYPLANAIKDVDKNLTQLKNDLVAQAKDLILLEKRVDYLDKKVSKTLGKQNKMQDKLNHVKDILNNMETK